MCKQSEHSEGAAQDGTTLISVGRAAQKKKTLTKIPSHGRRASCTRIAPASRPPVERAGGDLGESHYDGGGGCENAPLRRPPHL